MNKFFVTGLFLLLSMLFVSAQKSELLVKSSEKGLYLEHKVAPKESFYSVGRLYNVSPQLLASFNKLNMNKGLFIDQKIRIPLTDTNFVQQGNSGTPVYYKVKDRMPLADISTNMGLVSRSDLQSWNNLSGDEVKGDSKIIIGFLKSKEMPSVTLKNMPVKTEPVVKVKEKPVDPPEGKPVAKTETKPISKTEELPVEKKVEIAVDKPDEKPGPKKQGYFMPSFEKQVKTTPAVKNEMVTAGIFRTISGWQDGKYYLLIDDVRPGIIVKVINPANNKAVYAKVLGEMAGIRQNDGYNIRISNAAASVLEIGEQDKFIVKINY